MLNLTVMTGRLVDTPELRQTTHDSIAVTSFRVAVRRDFVKHGEEDTDFFDVTAWRTTAEFICKYFKKGSLIHLTGRLQNRKWKDKNDQQRVNTELIADKAYFGDSKERDSETADNVASSEADTSVPPSGFDPFS